MASVASQLIEEGTAYAQSDSLEDVREIRADGTYFPINLRSYMSTFGLSDVFLFDHAPCFITYILCVFQNFVFTNLIHLLSGDTSPLCCLESQNI